MNRADPIRIVMATDVRFWHHQTGAQRRILSMVSYLQDAGFHVTTLFVGSLADPKNGRTVHDELRTINDRGLKVRGLLEHWQPIGRLNQVKWTIQCTANWILQLIQQRTNRTQPGTRSSTKPAVPVCRYLGDFVSPVFADRFRDMVGQLEPDIVLFQYVTMAYLVPDSGHGAIRPWYVVDTHDLLSSRFRQFRKHGFEHWIRITRNEEAAALSKFDLIIAIQSQEQKEFQLMTDGKIPVIVAGHPCQVAASDNHADRESSRFTLGYFGSDNPSNTYSIEWFIEHVWNKIRLAQPEFTLLVAGTVCRGLTDKFRHAASRRGITLQATVDDIPALYQTFDIAINPVQFGTGLKIKNQEALAYGLPVVTTSHAADAMWPASENEFPSPIRVADTADEMAGTIVRLATAPQELAATKQAAFQYAAEKLTNDFTYRSLVDSFRQLASERKCR